MKRYQILILCLFALLSGCDSTSRSQGEGLTPVQTMVSDVSSADPAVIVMPSETRAMVLSSPTFTFTPNLPATQETIVESQTPTPQPTLPNEHQISGVYGHKQYFSLGCEAGVAVDWASYFGVDINEFEFQTLLPLSDNPELGFVGSVDGPWGQVPPYAYGVHAAPVANLLQTYGLDALDKKNYTLQELKQQIALDQPVIAWVIGNVVGGIPYEYTDSAGNTTIVAAYEHVIIVFGYTQEMIRYNNNGKVYDIPVEVFENSWSILGNMALVMGENGSSASQ